jgi:hypothetical protein
VRRKSHARFWIGGGESDLLADHTKQNAKKVDTSGRKRYQSFIQSTSVCWGKENTMAFEVFISYAHEDQAFLKELEKHLAMLKRQNIIASWYDGDITPGEEWKTQIMERLDSAQIILRPVDWKGAPFAKLQALPTGGKPVTRWPTHDDAFLDVVQGIRKAIDDLTNKRKTANP